MRKKNGLKFVHFIKHSLLCTTLRKSFRYNWCMGIEVLKLITNKTDIDIVLSTLNSLILMKYTV